jgi:dephospho-CoA kinase
MVELEQARLERAGHALACYDVPLLFETAQQDKYRPVLVVTANDEVRLERIMRRDGLDRAAAEARLRAQIPLEEKAKWADIVLVNNGSWDDLERNAARALDEVRAWK